MIEYIQFCKYFDHIANSLMQGNTQLGHYCGDDLPHPRTITTTKDVLLVRFLSDYSVAANGFRLEWVIQGCGGVLRKVQTVFYNVFTN